MKKIYLLLATFTLSGTLLSQVTLTKAFNSFVSGDVLNTTMFDSTSAVPKNTGTNQLWNFTSLTANSQTSSITYTNSASVTGSSYFPTATIAEVKAGDETGFYNTSGTNLEFLGFYHTNGPMVINLSNTAIMAAWPISYGSANNDNFSGTITTGTVQLPISGNVIYSAAGSGTVVLPGGTTYNNCLLVIRTLSVNLPSGLMIEKSYSFYTPAFKFPVVEYLYNTEQGTTDFEFKVLSSAITGLNQNEVSDTELTIYPNPSSSSLNINSSLSIESGLVIDMYGKKVLSFDGSSADISMLDKGVYTIVMKHRNGTATRKLVKN